MNATPFTNIAIQGFTDDCAVVNKLNESTPQTIPIIHIIALKNLVIKEPRLMLHYSKLRHTVMIIIYSISQKF